MNPHSGGETGAPTPMTFIVQRLGTTTLQKNMRGLCFLKAYFQAFPNVSIYIRRMEKFLKHYVFLVEVAEEEREGKRSPFWARVKIQPFYGLCASKDGGQHYCVLRFKHPDVPQGKADAHRRGRTHISIPGGVLCGDFCVSEEGGTGA